MAVAGSLIVMAGLTVLAFVISQLYRVVGLFEKRKSEPELKDSSTKSQSVEKTDTFDFPLTDLGEAKSRCVTQSAILGEPFELKALFGVLRENGWPAPHLTIRSFRESGRLVPDGEGLFSWKK